MTVIYPFPSYSGYTWSTPVVPKLYWDVYSQEQRIKALCMEYAKLIAYNSDLADTLNNYIEIVNTLQGQLPDLVNEDVKEQINELVTSGQFAEMVKEAIEQLTTDVQDQLDALNKAIEDEGVNRLNADNALQAQINADKTAISDLKDTADTYIATKSNMPIVSIARIRADADNYDHYMFTSYNGIDFTAIKKLEGLTSDSSFITKINGWYYYCGNNIWACTKDITDFKNATTGQFNPKSSTGYSGNIWACILFQNIDGKIYAFSSTSYDEQNMEIVRQDVEQDEETGELTFTNDTTLYTGGNYIDPAICWDGIYGYFFAYVTNPDGIIHIYNGPTLENLTLIGDLPGFGIEAPMFHTDGLGNVVIYAHAHSGVRTINNTAPDPACVTTELLLRATIAKTTQAPTNNVLYDIVNMPFMCIHPGYMQCDSQAMRQIADVKPFTVTNTYNGNIVTRNITNSTYTITNAPNNVFIVSSPSAATLNFIKLFNNINDVKFVVNTSTSAISSKQITLGSGFRNQGQMYTSDLRQGSSFTANIAGTLASLPTTN